MSAEISVNRPDARISMACVKLRQGEREVSISCDDSLGAFVHYERADIRCYEGPNFEKDRTSEVFGLSSPAATVPGTLDNLQLALAWLRQLKLQDEVGFLRQVLQDAASEKGVEKVVEELERVRKENAFLRAQLVKFQQHITPRVEVRAPRPLPRTFEVTQDAPAGQDIQGAVRETSNRLQPAQIRQLLEAVARDLDEAVALEPEDREPAND